jgi:hypothetical protein
MAKSWDRVKKNKEKNKEKNIISPQCVLAQAGVGEWKDQFGICRPVRAMLDQRADKANRTPSRIVLACIGHLSRKIPLAGTDHANFNRLINEFNVAASVV